MINDRPCSSLFSFIVWLTGLLISASAVADDATRLRLGGSWVPLMMASADIDPDELDGGILFDHELEPGSGYSLRLSRVQRQFSHSDVLSLAYYQTHQREKGPAQDAVAHAFYVEAGQEYRTPAVSVLEPYAALTGGAGVMKFDFRQNTTDEWSGAASIGVSLGVLVAQRLNLGFGGKLYLWGYPGETVGDGALVETSLAVEF